MEFSQSGLGKISRLTFGCEYLGGSDWGVFNEEGAKQTLFRALDEGITTLDVADVYGLGQAENRLAQWLGPRLKDLLVITKGGIRWFAGAGNERARTSKDGSPAYLESAVVASLKRLNIDCIPLYLFHWPDPQTPVEESVEALESLKRRGLIKEFGVSNFNLDQLQRAVRVAKPFAIESSLSLINPEILSNGVIDLCRAQKIQLFVYGTLAQGLLTGKYSAQSQFPESDRRHRLNHFSAGNLEKNLEIVDNLTALAKEHNTSPSQLAVRWVLDKPGVSSAVVGAKSPEQISMLCQIFDMKIDYFNGL